MTHRRDGITEILRVTRLCVHEGHVAPQHTGKGDYICVRCWFKMWVD